MARLSTSSTAFLLGIASFALQTQSMAFGLPEGAGRELVTGVCTVCHQANQITRSSGYTAEGWKELTGTMIDLSGSPQQQNEIVQYLAEHFPPNTNRAPTLMPGDVEVAFEEWQVPTLGQ